HFPPLTSAFQYLSVALGAIVLLGTLGWAWGFASIYRNDNTRVQASRWIYQNVPGPFNLTIDTGNGQAYQEPLPAPDGVVVRAYREPLPAPDGVAVQGNGPYQLQFNAHVSGNLSGFSMAFARNPNDPPAGGKVHIQLAADPGFTQMLAQGDATVPAQGGEAR